MRIIQHNHCQRQIKGKSFLCTCFFLFLILILPNPALTKDSVRIGYFIAPPHFVNPVNKKGSLIHKGTVNDWITSCLSDTEIIWSKQVFRRLVKSMKEGSIDMIPLMIKRPLLEKNGHYSEQPMFVSSPGIAVEVAHPLKKLTQLSQLDGVKIQVADGGYLHPAFQKNKNIIKKKFSGGSAFPQMMKMLIAGRIEAMYMPEITSLNFLAKAMKLSDRVRIFPLVSSPIPFHLIFSNKIDKGTEEFLTKKIIGCKVKYKDFLLKRGQFVLAKK